MRNIASRLDDDFQSLEDDVDLFAEGKKSKTVDPYRTALRQMRAMFSKAPEVTIARIEFSRFVDALRMFSAHATVADVARATGADEGDLRVFLNEASATGLTEAGQAVVNGLDGRLRRAADANVALRVQSWERTAHHTGQTPTQAPSPYHLSPMSSSAFPNFSGLDGSSGYAQYGGQSGSAQHGTDSIYGGLGSLGSAAHYGSYGAHPDTPQEVTQPTQAPSPYHLSPMSSSAFPHFSGLDDQSAAYSGGHGFDLNTPSAEAIQQAHGDSPFQDLSLSSLNSAAHYGSHDAAYPSTPSEVTGPSQAGQPLPTGPMRGSLNRVLTQLNLEQGFASGDALNCLIDTALQLTTGVRRPDNGHTPMHQLDQTVPAWRQHLFVAGVVPQHGMIDLYSANLAGANLAHNLNVRIQIVQWENGRATAHPVLGQQGPLVHILHTPGHFQPLWPRND